jgi:hypothetical protein
MAGSRHAGALATGDGEVEGEGKVDGEGEIEGEGDCDCEMVGAA